MIFGGPDTGNCVLDFCKIRNPEIRSLPSSSSVQLPIQSVAMLDIDKFIALVEEEGELWDVGNAAYKDKNGSPQSIEKS